MRGWRGLENDGIWGVRACARPSAGPVCASRRLGRLSDLFYQDHLYEPSPLGLNKGSGPDWGHIVSKDMVHWAHLPVAIWNDVSAGG